MASSSVEIALLALFLCSNALITTAAKDLDFHYLVLMWPGSYCKQASDGCCFPTTGKPKLDFFVGGLLPYSKDGTPLTRCKLSPFHVNQLDDIEEELHSYWPSIKCPSNDGRSLWLNTWKTYGVCTSLSEHDYFKKALDLRTHIDLYTIFLKNGIISTDYADYSFPDVLAAVENGIGARAAIHCAKNAWGESIIFKVFICVNKDATKIIECPVLPENECADRVVFGAFTYDMLSNKTGLRANPIRMRVQNL